MICNIPADHAAQEAHHDTVGILDAIFKTKIRRRRDRPLAPIDRRSPDRNQSPPRQRQRLHSPVSSQTRNHQQDSPRRDTLRRDDTTRRDDPIRREEPARREELPRRDSQQLPDRQSDYGLVSDRNRS